MAVSKRTRYEILKRDGHACRYCGGAAPDVRLTVDHVTPTALGGSDDPSNLVAACGDCNAGKSSTSPDDGLVADVREDALRYAELTRQAYAILVDRIGERTDYEDEFEEAYTFRLPDDWRNSIGRWFEMGVPIELITDAAQAVCAKPRQFAATGRFAYMCGMVWNQVKTVTAEAADRIALDGAWMTGEDITEKGIEDYLKGRRAEAKAWEPVAAPAVVLENFIDRGKVGVYPITNAVYWRAA